MKWICSLLKRIEVCHGLTVADSYMNLSAQESCLQKPNQVPPQLCPSVEKQPSQSFIPCFGASVPSQRLLGHCCLLQDYEMQVSSGEQGDR